MDPIQTLGTILSGDHQRDAVHVAIAPVVAAHTVAPGSHIGLDCHGMATPYGSKQIGIADPFLTVAIRKGETFWLFLYPNTVTSLRHEWTHPAFAASPVAAAAGDNSSESWMRKWAIENLADEYYEYYGDGEVTLSGPQKQTLYEYAIHIGETHSAGRCETARDAINNEWWNHWEIITGKKGDRDTYIRCGC
jgi:hypothetical protein